MRVDQLGLICSPKNYIYTAFKSNLKDDVEEIDDNSSLIMASLSALALGGAYTISAVKKHKNFKQFPVRTFTPTHVAIRPDKIKLYALQKKSEQLIKIK